MRAVLPELRMSCTCSMVCGERFEALTWLTPQFKPSATYRRNRYRLYGRTRQTSIQSIRIRELFNYSKSTRVHCGWLPIFPTKAESPAFITDPFGVTATISISAATGKSTRSSSQRAKYRFLQEGELLLERAKSSFRKTVSAKRRW